LQRKATKLAEIVKGLVILVMVLTLALQCLLGKQGAFYVCELKMRGNTTNVRKSECCGSKQTYF
jgi:hypothetical protein